MSGTTSASISETLALWNAAFERQQHTIDDPHPELRETHYARPEYFMQKAKLIRKLYVEGHKNTAFTLYLGLIIHYGGLDKIKRIERFQFMDMLLAIHAQECALVRSRRGGKSRDLSLIAVFWTIVGKRVIWYAPESDQLEQAFMYFHSNPFVDHASSSTGKVYSILPGPIMQALVLSKGKTASRGADCLIYDEGGKIDVNLSQYENYLFSRAIVADSIWEGDKHILHASTPCIATALERVVDKLKADHEFLVSVHPYWDCWWITDAWVDSERAANPSDPWYVQQEYECEFVTRGGAVFTNIKVVSKEEILKHTINRVGVDVNKEEMLCFMDKVRIGQDIHGRPIYDKYILAEMTTNWTENDHCFDFLIALHHDYYDQWGNYFYITADRVIEWENGGYNEKQAQWAARLLGARVMEWTDEIKGERMSIMRQGTIYICPELTPQSYTDLRSCIFHPLKPIFLKDNKHPNHWTDCILHAVGAEHGRFLKNLSAPPEQRSLPQHLQRKYKRR